MPQTWTRPGAAVPPASSLAITLLLGTALSALLLPAAAWAAEGSTARPRRVAVLGLEAADLPARLAAQTTTAVRSQVATFPDLILVAKDAVTLSEAALTFSCIDESAACMAQIGQELGAQVLIYGRLKAYPGQQAHLVLHVVDVQERRAVASEKGIFALSLLEEGAARLAAQLLARQASSTQGWLALTILQAGARVYLDDRLVAQAPLPMPLLAEPGVHELKVVYEGFQDHREMIDVQPGETVRREIDLEAVPDEYTPPSSLTAEAIPSLPRSSPPALPRAGGRQASTARLLGWGLLGSGALVAGVGGTFSVLLLQTQQQFDETTYQRQARELKDAGESYALTARVLYGVGGALALSGAILLFCCGGGQPEPAATPDLGVSLNLQPLLLPSPRDTVIGASIGGRY